MVSFGVLVVLELQMSSLPSVHLLLSAHSIARILLESLLLLSVQAEKAARVHGTFFGATLFNARSSMRSSILRRLASLGVAWTAAVHDRARGVVRSYCLVSRFSHYRHTFPAGGTRVHKCSLLHSPDGVQY